MYQHYLGNDKKKYEIRTYINIIKHKDFNKEITWWKERDSNP